MGFRSYMYAGFNWGGGVFPNFPRLLAAKLYIGCENILSVQEWYQVLCRVCWVWDVVCRRREEGKKFDVLFFVRHAFERQSCERYIVIKPFDLRKDIDIVG